MLTFENYTRCVILDATFFTLHRICCFSINREKKIMDSQDVNLSKICKKGDWERFQVLINDGVNINDIDKKGNTIFHYAAKGDYFIYF